LIKDAPVFSNNGGLLVVEDESVATDSAVECTPQITLFQVFDSDTDLPVGTDPVDSIINADGVQVCFPESGSLNIVAIGTCLEGVDSVKLKLTRPNDSEFSKNEKLPPHALFGDNNGDLKGRSNFKIGKIFNMYARPNGFSSAGSLSYNFQFKVCELSGLTPSPSASPSSSPNAEPSPAPTPSPSASPSSSPSAKPSPAPTPKPFPSDLYNIYLDLAGVPSTDEHFFSSTQARWETVIASGLTGGSTYGLNPPPLASCSYQDQIDDVYMCAGYDYIDGPSNIF